MAEEAKIVIKIDDTEIRRMEDVEAQVKGLPTRGEPEVARGGRGTRRPAPGSTAERGFFQRNLSRADGTIRGQLGGIAQNLGAQANPFSGSLRGVGAALTLTTASLAKFGKDDPTGILNLVNRVIKPIEQGFNKRLDIIQSELAGRQKAFEQFQSALAGISLLGIDPQKSGLDLKLVANVMRVMAVGEHQSNLQIERELHKRTVAGIPLEEAFKAGKDIILGDLDKAFMAAVKGGR